jgi:hypothetical protein
LWRMQSDLDRRRAAVVGGFVGRDRVCGMNMSEGDDEVIG